MFELFMNSLSKFAYVGESARAVLFRPEVNNLHFHDVISAGLTTPFRLRNHLKYQWSKISLAEKIGQS